MVKVTVRPVARADRALLRNLMEFYLYDFSEFTEEDVDDDGVYGYEYLDDYWTQTEQHAFLIRVDAQPAGFALVRILHLETGETVHAISEFFVMRKYRDQGVGREAAHQIFDRFPGRWRVGERRENRGAQIFWRRVIGEYTGGDFEEITHPRWDGPMQTFETPEAE